MSRKSKRARRGPVPQQQQQAPVAPLVPGEDMKALARFLEVAEEEPALKALAAAANAYGLSPYLGEVFLIDTLKRSRDGEGHLEERWIKRPATGRDGFLSVAMKSGVHRGLQGDVVCANDTFDVDWSASGDRPAVIHRHAPLVAGKSPEEARSYRGPILGAWAKGYRADMVPFFYFAPLREHGRTWSAEGRTGWAGAWEYTSAMIVKCAQSYVLRMLYSITGIVPADELKNDPTLLDGPSIDIEQVLDVAGAVPVTVASEVGERLLAAVNEANELDPSLWPAAKCEMTFAGRDDAELDRLAGEIEKVSAGIRASRERERHAVEREAVMPSSGPQET